MQFVGNGELFGWGTEGQIPFLILSDLAESEVVLALVLLDPCRFLSHLFSERVPIVFIGIGSFPSAPLVNAMKA